MFDENSLKDQWPAFSRIVRTAVQPCEFSFQKGLRMKNVLNVSNSMFALAIACLLMAGCDNPETKASTNAEATTNVVATVGGGCCGSCASQEVASGEAKASCCGGCAAKTGETAACCSGETSTVALESGESCSKDCNACAEGNSEACKCGDAAGDKATGSDTE